MIAELYNLFTSKIGIISILTILIGIWWFFASYIKTRKNAPPGPRKIPFIGNLHQLGHEPYKTFTEMRKTYGDVISIQFGSFEGIVINGHKSIKEAFALNEMSGRPPLRPFVERCGGKRRGFLMNEGPVWKEQRRFAIKTLRDFGFGRKTMEELIMQDVEQVLDTLESKGNSTFKAHLLFNAAVVNSLWSILTGERLEHDDPKMQKIIKTLSHGLEDTGTAGVHLFFPGLSKIFPNATGYNSFLEGLIGVAPIISEMIKKHQNNFASGVSRDDFIFAYLQQAHDTLDPHSSFFGEEGIKNLEISMSDIFLGGVETVSTTLTWTVLLLAINPEVQNKLWNEIDAKIGRERSASLVDRPNTPYTEAVVMEILRFASILPLGVMHSTLENVKFQGYDIPKDTMVMANIYGSNHDPHIWNNPEDFNPERFLHQDGTLNKNQEGFLSFSIGKRVCPGENLGRDQLYLFISNIYKQFCILPDPAQPKPKIDYFCSFVLIPKPYQYVLKKRT